jgi:hypothetical protein
MMKVAVSNREVVLDEGNRGGADSGMQRLVTGLGG